MNWYKLAQELDDIKQTENFEHQKMVKEDLQSAISAADESFYLAMNNLIKNGPEIVVYGKPQSITDEQITSLAKNNIKESIPNTVGYPHESFYFFHFKPNYFYDRTIMKINHLKSSTSKIDKFKNNTFFKNGLFSAIENRDYKKMFDIVYPTYNGLYGNNFQLKVLNYRNDEKVIEKTTLEMTMFYLNYTFGLDIKNPDYQSLYDACLYLKDIYDYESDYDFYLENYDMEKFNNLIEILKNHDNFEEVKNSYETIMYAFSSPPQEVLHTDFISDVITRDLNEVVDFFYESYKEYFDMISKKIIFMKYEKKFDDQKYINYEHITKNDIDRNIFKKFRNVTALKYFYFDITNEQLEFANNYNDIIINIIISTFKIFLEKLNDKTSFGFLNSGLRNFGENDFCTWVNFVHKYITDIELLNKIKYAIETRLVEKNNREYYINDHQVKELTNKFNIEKNIKMEFLKENLIQSESYQGFWKEWDEFIEEFGTDSFYELVYARFFGSRNSTLHDIMVVFEEDVISETIQEKLSQFIKKNELTNTPDKELKFYLNIRQNALDLKRLLPGIYIDDEREFFKYLYKNKMISSYNDDQRFKVIKNENTYNILDTINNKVVKENINNENLAKSIATFYENRVYPDTINGLMDYQKDRLEKDIPAKYRDFYLNLLKFGYDKDMIISFLDKIKIPKNSNINTSKKVIDDFTFEILEKNNPLGIVLGNITECCQTISGASSSAVLDGYNNPNSGFLAIYDNNGNIVAQSWLRLGTSNNLYLDNVETIDSYRVNKDSNKNRSSKLSSAILKWAIEIKAEYGFNGILVGTGYSDVLFPEQYNSTLADNLDDEFPDTFSTYTDLKGVWKLAFNLQNIKVSQNFIKII
jgi:hypothetical protein